MKHPQDQLIEQLANGDVLTPLATLISSHVEVCSECREKYNFYLSEGAKELTANQKSDDFNMDDIFTSVLGKIEAQEYDAENAKEENLTVTISGEVIELPSALNFLRGQNIPWKEFGKKNAIAPVSLGKEGNLYLIYIGPGECVPQHDHSGSEYSYVVAGSYNDGFSHFETGDFSLSEKGHEHSPKATSDDGCLVVSWVEGRLNYFSGIFKPLNSLLWWYLHKA